MSATATLPRPATHVLPLTRLGDEALASRAAGGSNAAFTTLYERYHGPLLGYTRSILRDAEDANDATQNALENALRALPTRDTSRPLRPWLYKIAHNEAINIMRRRQPQDELTPAFEPTVPGPEVDAEQRGRLAQLVDDLQSLPERQRGALVMRELNGLSYDEIGTALGLTNEAARRAVFDARDALHDAADGRATECVSVRHKISDGDRRSLRARSIRAHLRSCDDCASFSRSIGARRADLHMLAPWMGGAAVMGAFGLGTGGTSGAAMVATGGGASAAAGGGGIWASLPAAAKGIAVAAAVATTGTAAVEIKHAAEPPSKASAAQTAQARPSTRANALALRAAALAASTAAQSRAIANRPARVRTSAKSTTSSAGSSATTKRRDNVAALLPPAPVAVNPPPAAVPPPPPPPPAAVPAATAQTAPSGAVAKLDRLGDQVKQVLADATAIAADGTQEALALAIGPARPHARAAARRRSTASSHRSGCRCRARPRRPRRPRHRPRRASSRPSTRCSSGIESLLQTLLGTR